LIKKGIAKVKHVNKPEKLEDNEKPYTRLL